MSNFMHVNLIRTMDNVILPRQDREYLNLKGFNYRETQEGDKKALIIDNFQLPETKFTENKSTLMIYLPDGYPDVPPDMFYFSPALLLNPNNNQPAAANVQENYLGIIWQRWSRHAPSEDWRRGIDGIHSYLQRVILALKIAS